MKLFQVMHVGKMQGKAQKAGYVTRHQPLPAIILISVYLQALFSKVKLF